MQKIILFSVLCTGFVMTMPIRASGLDRQEASRNFVGSGDGNENRSTNSLLAQDRRHETRWYYVYYRKPRDLVWIFGGFYTSRRDAERAARRWEWRGYRTDIREKSRHDRGRHW